MPRCQTCAHNQRQKIDRLLVNGESYRNVAERVSLSQSSVYRHAQNHLPTQLADAAHAERIDDAVDLMTELRDCIGRVKLMVDATDRWLRDPDDPERYDVGPRSEDVTVIYERPSPAGRGKLRRKERLSAILERIEGHGYDVQFVESKHADPRGLLLKALARMEGHLTLVAKLAGELDERAQVNIIASPEWLRIQSVIVDALAPYPDARVIVAAALRELDA